MIASIGAALTAPVSSTPASLSAAAGPASGGALDFAAMIANIAAPADQPAAAPNAEAAALPVAPALFAVDSGFLAPTVSAEADAPVAGDEPVAESETDEAPVADPSAMPMVLIPGLVTIQPPTLQQLPSEQSAADHTDNDAPRGACDGGASERGVGRRGPHGARVDAPPALDAADDDSTPASNTAPDQTAVFDVGNDDAASNSAQSAAAAPPASARRAFASTQAARALERAVQDVTPREGDRANNVETKAANTPRLSDALNQAGARISAPTTSTTPQTAPETAAPQSASSTLQSFAQGGGSTNNGSGSNASRDDRSADPQAIAAAAKADHHDATTTTRTVDVHVNPAATSHVTTDAPVASGASGPIPDETMTQIVQQVRLQWRDGIGDARIMLDPDYLGGVNISLRVEAGAVTATVNADSAAVRTWIESNEGMLRQGLAEHGLTLERLVIAGEKTDTPRDARQSNERGREEQPRRERRQPQKPTELFELTV